MGVARGNIKATISVDGEQEYARKMQALRKEQQSLRSEANALTSTYDENTSAVQKLQDKKAILTKQIEAQKKIVAECEKEYDKQIDAETRDIEKTEEATSKYNNAAAVLNNYEKQLKSVDDELYNLENGIESFDTKISRLEKQQDSLNSKSKLLASTYDENTSAVQKLTDKHEILSEQIKVQKQIVVELKSEQQKIIDTEGEQSEKTAEMSAKYNDAYAKLNIFEKELKDVDTELEQHNGKLKNATKEIQDFGDSIQNAGGKIENAGKKFSVLSGVAAAGVYSAVDAAIDYESAFAGVKKTVDATEEEYEQMYDAILNLSTELPATASDIAAVAESAGQLGIARENIVDFTEVMINLGESTNLTSDEAATALAKFANITGMQAEDYERLGSVIVDLGNNFATTEADIVSMATRLAATGSITGLSEAQIMALSTALSSAGIEAEAGGSSMSKLLKKMNLASETYDKANEVIDKTGMSLRDLQLLSSNNSSDFKDLAQSIGYTSDELKNYIKNADMLERFAKISGVSAEEFQKAYGEDSVKALSMFIDGLRDTERNGAGAVEILNDMGLTEVRLSNTVLALTKSENLMTSAIDTANTAWDENTALTNEAEKRYETLESQIQMVKNTLTEVAIGFGEELMPYVKEGADKIKDLAKSFSELDDEQKRNILKFAAFVIAAGPVVTVTGKLTSGVGSVVTAGGKLIETLAKLKTGEAVFAIQKLNRALYTAEEAELAASTGANFVASSLASGGALAIGILTITALVAGLALGLKAMDEGTGFAKVGMTNLGESIEDFKTKLNEAEGDISDIKKALDFDDKDSELESKYENISDKIKAIAQNASDERRALTDSEIEKLNSLFEELNLVTEAEIKLFTATQDSIQSLIEAEDQLTDEEAAKFLKKSQTALDAQLEQIEQNYTSGFGLLKNKYATEEEWNSEACQKEIANLQEVREKQRQAAIDEYNENANLISNKLFNSKNGYDQMFQAFLEYNNSMQKAEDEYYSNLESGTYDSTTLFQEYTSEVEAIKEEFASNFINTNSEVIGNYIGFVATMIENGYELSDEQELLVKQIIDAYDTLPKGTSDALKDSMDLIKETIDDADLESKGKELGNNINKGVEKGLNESNGSVTKTLKQQWKEWWNALTGKDGADTNSPSKKTTWLGEMLNEGEISGLDKTKDKLIKTAKTQINELLDVYSIETQSIPTAKIYAQYKAALAENAAFQKALYAQNVTNNYSNDNSSRNYYSAAAVQNSNNEKLNEIAASLQSIANSSNNVISERMIGQAVIKCLKSVGVRL